MSRTTKTLAMMTAGLLGLSLPGLPAAASAAAPSGSGASIVLVQEGGIKGQDPSTAGKGEVATGWVQAPVPRDAKAPQQPAQGAGATPVGTQPPQTGGQAPPGQNPGTVVHNPLPTPGDAASGK